MTNHTVLERRKEKAYWHSDRKIYSLLTFQMFILTLLFSAAVSLHKIYLFINQIYNVYTVTHHSYIPDRSCLSNHHYSICFDSVLHCCFIQAVIYLCVISMGIYVI